MSVFSILPDKGVDLGIRLDVRAGGELDVAVFVEGGLREDLPAQLDRLPHLPPVDLCNGKKNIIAGWLTWIAPINAAGFGVNKMRN